MWERGILPPAMAARDGVAQRSDVRTWKVGEFARVIERGGQVYTDGAGPIGRPARPGAHVHAGAVAVIPEADGNGTKLGDFALLMGQVPGKQTVPRAEIWALVLAASAAPAGQDFEVGIDASYVTNGCSRADLVACGLNGDLWCTLFNVVADRGGRVVVKKVESHLAEKGAAHIITKRPTVGDVTGNAMADQAANLARQLDGRDGQDLQWSTAYGRTVNIVKRLAVIQARIWQSRDGAKLYEPIAAEDGPTITKQSAIQEAVAAIGRAGHHVVAKDNGFRCTRCGHWRKHIQDWAKEKCRRRLNATQMAAKHYLQREGRDLNSWDPRGGGVKRGCSSPRRGASESLGHEGANLTQLEVDITYPDGNSNADDGNEHVHIEAEGGGEADGSGRRLNDGAVDGITDDLPATSCGTEGNGGGRWDDVDMVDDESVDGHGTYLESSHPFDEPPMEPPPPLPETQGDGETVDRAGGLPRRVRRRLNAKVSPAGTAYEQEAGQRLLTLREHRAEVARLAAKRRRTTTGRKATVEAAWSAIEGSVRAGHAIVGDDGDGNDCHNSLATAHGPLIHPTHDLRKAHNAEFVFCNVCAAWTSGMKARVLKWPCRGQTAQASLLRRLQLGVTPAPGAKILAPLRRDGRRPMCRA